VCKCARALVHVCAWRGRTHACVCACMCVLNEYTCVCKCLCSHLSVQKGHSNREKGTKRTHNKSCTHTHARTLANRTHQSPNGRYLQVPPVRHSSHHHSQNLCPCPVPPLLFGLNRAHLTPTLRPQRATGDYSQDRHNPRRRVSSRVWLLE